MKEFVNGFVFAVFLIVLGIFFLLIITRVEPTLTAVRQELPKELQDYIKRNLSRDESDHCVGDIYMSPTMDIAWLNLIFTRLFFSLRSSNLYKMTTLERISMKMNSNLKKGLLKELNLIDLDLGDYAPKVMGARIIKGITPDLAIQMEFDIVYQGGASIAIEAIISGGIKLPTRIYLNGFAGQLRFRLPSLEAVDKIGVAFVKDPGVTFSIDAPLSAKTSDTVRGMVNRVLESVARKVFLDYWVLPSWVKFYLPMMNPNINSVSNVNSVLTASATEVKDKVPEFTSFSSSLALKAATMLKFKSFSDFDPFSNIFSIGLNVYDMPKESMKLMEDELVKKFMEICNIAHTQNLDDQSLWKTYKKKGAVDYYKRIASNNEKIKEMYKARISIQCDFARVFSLLSNSEHFRYITDFFENATSLSQYDGNFSVEKVSFKRTRASPISAVLFVVKKEISDFSFLVVFRSAMWEPSKSIPHCTSKTESDIIDDSASNPALSLQESPENELRNRRMPRNVNNTIPEAVSSSDTVHSKVYLFGYLIEMDPESPASLSNVTLLSCASPAISAHLGTFKFCSKLKSFIEELVSLSSSISAQDPKDSNPEDRKSDAQGNKIDKLKSYFGSTASYLMKMKSKENYRSDSDISDDESFSTSRTNLTSPAENRTSFDDQNYVDFRINSRDILRIPMEYVPSLHSDPAKFNWEFMSLTELPIYFGIEFSPSDSSEVYSDFHYEKTVVGSWVIFPFSCISAYAKPAFGKIVINNFPAGKFIVTFDNLATSNRATRQLTTRCWISSSYLLLNDSDSPNGSDIYQKPISECHFEFTVPRKTMLPVPIPFYLPKTEKSQKIHLNWDVNTGGSDIYFSIFYQEEKSKYTIEGVTTSEEYPLEPSSIGSMDSNINMKKGAETSQAKISKFLGKAKEVYKDVKTVINQPTSSSSQDQSFKSSLSSRINAVVAKSEMASRTIMKAMAGDSSQNPDSLFLESSSFIRNHPEALIVFPHSKINSTDYLFQGILEISDKSGCYFLLFENSQVLASPKQITCAITIN